MQSFSTHGQNRPGHHSSKITSEMDLQSKQNEAP